MSYTEHMGSRGLAPRSRVLFARVIDQQFEIAARLGRPATSQLVKIDRLRLTGELDEAQRARLADIAERTPVTLTLKQGVAITTILE